MRMLFLHWLKFVSAQVDTPIRAARIWMDLAPHNPELFHREEGTMVCLPIQPPCITIKW
jgi:hypothetical protein